jgi:hypothetical protein
MHLACHMRPNGNFFSQYGRRHAPQSEEFQQQGCFEAVSRYLLAVAW